MNRAYILLLLAVILTFTSCKKDDDATPTGTDCATQLKVAKQCKAILPDCGGEQLKTGIPCLGTNSSNGKRCGNTTKYPCGFCYLHLEQWTGTCPIMTKNACGYCDDHKDQHSE